MNNAETNQQAIDIHADVMRYNGRCLSGTCPSACSVMDFQTAPYALLCGCVSVVFPAGREPPPHIVRGAIDGCEGQRNVCANCAICGGTGITPNNKHDERERRSGRKGKHD